MAAQQTQQQEQQISPEMLKKMQGEQEKVKTNSFSRGNGSRHWIVKFVKDFSFLSFIHIILLKKFVKWILKDKKENQLVNIMKSDSNNDNISNHVPNDKEKITFEETDTPTTGIVTLAETAPEVDKLSSQFENEQWAQRINTSCDNEDSSLRITDSRKKTEPTIII